MSRVADTTLKHPSKTSTDKESARQPWALPSDKVLQSLHVHADRGLSAQEAAQRLAQYGPNELAEKPPEPFWERYWGQLTGDAVVILLLIGGVFSLVIPLIEAMLGSSPIEPSDFLEGVAIILMLNIMAGFGLWQEGQATDAARSLRKLDDTTKLVIRDGQRIEVPTREIVIGDIVFLPNGAIAPTDGRVITAVNAEKDSSKLTGESMPVTIDPSVLPAVTVINAQRNMVHRGDAIVGGNVTCVVTATGVHTEIGRIATTLDESEENKTPLDEQLDQLASSMNHIFIWIAAIVIGFGIVRDLFNQSAGFTTIAALTFVGILSMLLQAFINAVALIIAAIPEGLPAVLTITLAIAIRQMVRKNSLIRKPKAVEGGGSMTVLLTDKTGTLTANQMEVTHLYLNGRIMESSSLNTTVNPKDDRELYSAARIAKLCNNSSNSTDVALMRWIQQAGFEMFDDLMPTRATEHEFDQSLKRMTTIHARTDGTGGDDHIFTKGAPEHVLKLCPKIALNGQVVPMQETHRKQIQDAILELAGQELRVIALAERITPHTHKLSRAKAESNLTFVGLLGIMDPPRPDVASAVKQLAEAGIRTVMITGDNPITAYHIAKKVGIIDHDLPFDEAVITGEELDQLDNPTPTFLQRIHTVRVFARVTPSHKATIVQTMRHAGFIVGMTGDGVNDAIALKQSDIGFAMGNGTDVAREAADVILLDSRFGTIPSAVEEGRNVLYRIRLYLSYILSGNGSEVGAFIFAYLLNLPIPLTALTLLIINFATDSFPALAMTNEPGEADVMQRPPRRRDAPFISRIMWIHIAVQSIVATLMIIGVYYYFLKVMGTPLDVARAAAFMTYIFQKLYRAFTARSLTEHVWKIGLLRNRWTIGAVGVSLTIALFFVYTPIANTAVGMDGLSLSQMVIPLGIGLIAPVAEEITKVFLPRRS
jgi:P-type Ca2+ transporter type 2C